MKPGFLLRAGCLLALGVLAVSGAACKREIGDDCSTATDCDPNGGRACDLSQPGGYCTVQGCNETSCPSEAVCVRYFPAQFLAKPCDPNARGADAGACEADELCLPEGLCAPMSTERRFCAKSCSKNDDCRGGYSCRRAGTSGSVALTTDPKAIVHFCSPTVP